MSKKRRHPPGTFLGPSKIVPFQPNTVPDRPLTDRERNWFARMRLLMQCNDLGISPPPDPEFPDLTFRTERRLRPR